MALSFRQPWLKYAFAVAAVGLATAFSAAIQALTAGRTPYIAFFPAIILTAIYVGTRPGLLATFLSVIASPLLLPSPTNPFPYQTVGPWVTLGMFFVIAVFLVLVCRSATQSKIFAQAAYRDSRASELTRLAKAQELETVMKAVPAAIFIASDPQCQVVTGSSAAYQLLEVPEGQNLSQTQPGAGRPTHFEVRLPDGTLVTPEAMPLQKAATLGVPQREVRIDFVFENGKSKSLFGNAEPLLDAQGKPRGAVGAFVDVTSVIEADRAARIAAERFRVMADTAPVLVWIADTSKACVWFNKGWLDFTGRSMEDQLRHGWAEGIHPEDQDRCSASFNAYFDNREPFSLEYRRRNKDGEYRWLMVRSLALHEGHEGAFSGFIGTCVDITDRKLGEEQKASLLDAERAARMESERIGRMKDEFLATLSHELRTPLSAILGWSQLLTHGVTDADQIKQGLEAIARNARAQTQMIEDLLDMSRIISGKIRLNVQRADLPAVVEAAIESTLPTAAAKSVRLVKVLDPLAGPVSGDPGRLQQIIWNLLTNAIKFTPANGKVQVLLERVNSHVEISVSDTGLGIKPEFLPYVFDRFRQDDGSTTRKHGGLGLGLSIVKQLVELHGGTVRVASDGENKGSTFVVALPLAATHVVEESDGRQHPTAPGRVVEYEPPKLNGVRVLVVDDDGDTRTLIERIFTNYGSEVLVAASAADGLEIMKRERPQLIVSDIGMPGQDGYEFMRRVRALPPEQGGTTPSIALTAFARSEDRQRALMAGYQMHMAKPVEPSELVIASASLVGRPSLATAKSN